MENNNRRDFLKAGVALFATSTLGAVAAGCSNSAAKEVKDVPQRSKRRTLGTGDYSIEVSALGLGCMGMNYHRSFVPDKQAMIALMRRAVDLGVNLFDTAEAYGPFVNEQLIGEAIEPIRKDILVCTKWSYPVFMDSFWFVFLVLVRYCFS